MRLVDHRLDGVVLLIGVHEWIQFVLVRLVLEHFHVVLRRGEVVDAEALHVRLFVIADHHLLLIVVVVLRLDYVRVTFRGALLLRSLLLPTVMRMINFAISVLFSVFVLILLIIKSNLTRILFFLLDQDFSKWFLHHIFPCKKYQGTFLL